MRGRVLSYLLKVQPAQHLIIGNKIRNRIIQLGAFPKKTEELLIEVDFVAEMALLNPQRLTSPNCAIRRARSAARSLSCSNGPLDAFGNSAQRVSTINRIDIRRFLRRCPVLSLRGVIRGPWPTRSHRAGNSPA